MNTFEDFKIKKQLQNAIADLGFEKPTPIQQKSYSPIWVGLILWELHKPEPGKQSFNVAVFFEMSDIS